MADRLRQLYHRSDWCEYFQFLHRVQWWLQSSWVILDKVPCFLCCLTRLHNDLQCIDWDVTPYSLTHSLIDLENLHLLLLEDPDDLKCSGKWGCLSLRVNGHFPGGPVLSVEWTFWYQNVSILDFIGAKDDGSGGDNGTISRAKLQSKCHQQTNTQRFTGRMPSCHPTNSVKAPVIIIIMC